MIGVNKKIDKLGRITIPKEYREFYNMVTENNVCLINTPEGILITNPKYKVVKIEDEETDN